MFWPCFPCVEFVLSVQCEAAAAAAAALVVVMVVVRHSPHHHPTPPPPPPPRSLSLSPLEGPALGRCCVGH